VTAGTSSSVATGLVELQAELTVDVAVAMGA
jgi:hypothetical protein